MKQTPLKRKRVPRRTPYEREQDLLWSQHARQFRCAACDQPARHGHHVITKERLKQWAQRPLDGQYPLDQTFQELYDSVRWDKRNLLPLCELCHARHHRGLARLRLGLVLGLVPGVHEFARELGLEWWLEKEYA